MDAQNTSNIADSFILYQMTQNKGNLALVREYAQILSASFTSGQSIPQL